MGWLRLQVAPAGEDKD